MQSGEHRVLIVNFWSSAFPYLYWNRIFISSFTYTQWCVSSNFLIIFLITFQAIGHSQSSFESLILFIRDVRHRFIRVLQLNFPMRTGTWRTFSYSSCKCNMFHNNNKRHFRRAIIHMISNKWILILVLFVRTKVLKNHACR